MAEGVGFEPNQPHWERRGFGLQGTEKGPSVGQGFKSCLPDHTYIHNFNKSAIFDPLKNCHQLVTRIV
jgi:hypothetical protein